MNHLKAIMAMAQFRQIVASADEHGKPSILLDMEVARSVLDAFDRLIGGDLMPFMTAVAKEVRHLGPEWGVEFGAIEGNHVRVVVRHGQPGSRALLGELAMTAEEAHEFRAVVEPLGAHVTDVCGHCMGNQTIPCPKCQAKPVVQNHTVQCRRCGSMFVTADTGVPTIAPCPRCGSVSP